MKQFSRFLPVVRKTVTSQGAEKEDVQFSGNTDHIAARVKQISENVSNGTGSTNDLFDLMDLDKSGTISVEEFKMCTQRLGFQLGDHRMKEIFSKCKKNIAKAGDDNVV